MLVPLLYVAECLMEGSLPFAWRIGRNAPHTLRDYAGTRMSGHLLNRIARIQWRGRSPLLGE